MKAKVDLPQIRLETSLLGKPVPLWRRKWQRYLEFVGGVVAWACPITLYYSGAKRRAINVAMKIRKWGYKVEVKRERRKKRSVPALPVKAQEPAARPVLDVLLPAGNQGAVPLDQQARPKRNRAKVQRAAGPDNGGDAGIRGEDSGAGAQGSAGI